MADEDVSQFEYCLDGQGNVPMFGNTTLSGLSVGNHNVTVYGFDQLGNLGSSETIYFSIEPFPTTIVIAPIASVAILGTGLLVYFKKSRH
jgi:hypothetical protein